MHGKMLLSLKVNLNISRKKKIIFCRTIWSKSKYEKAKILKENSKKVAKSVYLRI